MSNKNNGDMVYYGVVFDVLLKEWMKDNNESITGFARKLGTTRQTVHAWINGVQPSEYNLECICQVFDVPVDTFFVVKSDDRTSLAEQQKLMYVWMNLVETYFKSKYSDVSITDSKYVFTERNGISITMPIDKFYEMCSALFYMMEDMFKLCADFDSRLPWLKKDPSTLYRPGISELSIPSSNLELPDPDEDK